MNLKKYTFPIFGLILLASSCGLDVKPPALIVEDTFWRTEKDATSYLNNIYSQMAPGSDIYGDAFTDDIYAQYSWESSGALFQQDQLNAANGSGWGFGGIAAVNEFLANVDKCTMDDALRERMKAEARAFRAIDYLGKTLSFGKVPIITTVLDPMTKEVPRNSVEEVRQFIYDELEYAASVLPEAYTNEGTANEKGRITKYAALAYLSRAALYFGDYKYAEETAAKVMAGPFRLFTISSLTANQELETKELDNYIDFDALGIDRDTFYKGLFSYESLWHDEYANTDNPEYIFSRQYADNLNSDQVDWSRYLALRTSQLGGWASLGPTQNLLNAYWTVDGKQPTLPTTAERKAYYEAIMKDFNTEAAATKISFVNFAKKLNDNKTIKNYDFIKEFRNRDSRMYASVLFPFKAWFETEHGTNFYFQWLKGAGNESKTGYGFRKITPLTKTQSGGEESTADYPSFRFAELLLIYAEARTQSTGYDQSVQDALNKIRTRAGMVNVPTSFASKDEALEFIRNERRVEMACEGRRSDDLTRYPSAYWERMMNNVPITPPDGDNIIVMKWSERMRLRPIPQTAIDKNAALDQNPGYN